MGLSVMGFTGSLWELPVIGYTKSLSGITNGIERVPVCGEEVSVMGYRGNLSVGISNGIHVFR